MSAAPPVDPGVEREIDLGALKDAVLARWWIAVVGLVVGVAIGAAYTLSFGTTWAASAIIAPGQAFSPNGNTVVLSYLSSQTGDRHARQLGDHARRRGGEDGRARRQAARARRS